MLSETTPSTASPITEVTKHGGSTKFDIMGNKRPSTVYTYSEIYTRLTRVQVLTLRCEVIFKERIDRVSQQRQQQCIDDFPIHKMDWALGESKEYTAQTGGEIKSIREILFHYVVRAPTCEREKRIVK